MSVAITGGVLFGEKGLSGFFHGKYVIEDNHLVEFIGWETELIFDLDKAFGFEVIIKLITLFGGDLFGEFEALKEVIDNFMEFNTIDGRLLLKDTGKVTGVDNVRLRDAKMFGNKDWSLV